MDNKPKVVSMPSGRPITEIPPRTINAEKILLEYGKAKLELDMANEEIVMLRQALQGAGNQFAKELNTRDEKIKQLEGELSEARSAGRPGSVIPFASGEDSPEDGTRLSYSVPEPPIVGGEEVS